MRREEGLREATGTTPPLSASHLVLLKELRDELGRQGFFAPSRFWTRNLLFWVPVLFASYLGLVCLPFGLAWLVLAPIASMAMLTMGFVGHDAGHYSISRKRWVNDVWGQFGMTFVCGMSFGFWRGSHNVHHAHCQEIGADPDMHFGVLFSVYPDSDSWHSRLGRFFLRIQKYAFWPLSAFYWVTLRYDGIRNLFRNPAATRVDRFLLPMHWLILVIVPGLVFGWGATLAAYLTASCVSSVMTASVFIPNHIGMRRFETGQKPSYLEQQITSSRNVTNPRAFDFYFGGLNSQIEHHLFPRASHERYRAMRPVVRAFCLKHGIAYGEQTFYDALAAVGRHLGEMTAAHAATSPGPGGN